MLRTRQLRDIFYVKKKQPLAVFCDGSYRIASTLEVVRHVQQQLDVARVSGLHDAIKAFRAFTERAHVVVIGQ